MFRKIYVIMTYDGKSLHPTKIVSLILHIVCTNRRYTSESNTEELWDILEKKKQGHSLALDHL